MLDMNEDMYEFKNGELVVCVFIEAVPKIGLKSSLPKML